MTRDRKFRYKGRVFVRDPFYGLFAATKDFRPPMPGEFYCMPSGSVFLQRRVGAKFRYRILEAIAPSVAAKRDMEQQTEKAGSK